MEFENKEYKTKIKIGNNIIIFQEKHYNWFRKLMYKFFFDIEIEDTDTISGLIDAIIKTNNKNFRNYSCYYYTMQ